MACNTGRVDARKGNQFWKARSSHGRKPLFDSPESLWDAAVEYFEWTANNPLLQEELVKFQGEATHVYVAKMRAMTIDGLCIFLDMSGASWYEYSRKKKGFSVVTAQIDKIIRTQKFQGAAADMLNPNIIARDLGLKDVSKHITDDGDGGDAPIGGGIDYSKLSKSALKEILDSAED